jgi:LytR cell envelope-related transcriptional attenuator
MQQAARSGLTLLVLALVVVLAGLWGWSALTQPFPGKTTPPKCLPTTVQKGEKVFPGQVTVSVYNASERNGLAGSTMSEFTDAGFAEGSTGNAPSKARVVRAQIWTTTPRSPDVRLVARHLGPSRVIHRDGPGVGVTVLVGPRYQGLVKGPSSVRATKETEICSPPVA